MHRTYWIANLSIKVSGTVDNLLPLRMAAYEHAFPQGQVFDMEVHFQNCVENITLPKGKVVAQMFARGWMALDDGGFALFDMLPEVTDKVLMLAKADASFRHVDVQFCDPSLLSSREDHRHYPLLGELFRILLSYHEGVILHASCLGYKKDALLFSAPSETGKSTHTALWCAAYPEDTVILNDDTPAIRWVDGKAVAFGTPWGGMSGINCNSSAPIKAIVFLEQQPENTICKLEGSQAVWRMIHETPKVIFPDATDRSLAMTERLLQQVPTYLLGCTISRQAVETVKDLLYGTDR